MSNDTKFLFRSISLRLDAKHPEHFSHYHPTSKSANVIRAVVNGDPDPASIVVASFGSGKTLAAGTGSLIVDNDPKSRTLLLETADRITKTDPKLGRFTKNRAGSSIRGVPILLEGHQPDLPSALLQAAKGKLKYLRAPKNSNQDVITTLAAIAERSTKKQRDRIAIVWDEFGQHLEALVSTGKSESLLEVQQIAEWAARQQEPSASLTLLQHQNLLQYAENLSQVARSSWRKIEGRFGAIQYVEDSDELFELVASVASELKPDGKLPPTKHFKDLANKAVAAGFFKSYSQRGSLHKVLSDAFPLLPATLHELPKMSSRLAQNERTIFTFLRSADYGKPVSLLDLYRYFSTAMQVDTGHGGTHRKWLETESALSKVSKPEEREILAAACLLGLGSSGQRTHVSKKALAFSASHANGMKPGKASKTISSLIERKLLLYRKNNDDISVWHGTDVDIRMRLQEIRDSLLGEIDIVDFLQREHPAPNWKPVKHNVDNSIRRYFAGRFALASKLCRRAGEHEALQLQPGDDGAIVFCIADNKKEIAQLKTFARRLKTDFGDRILIVIPNSPLRIAELVAEIVAIRKLQSETDLLAKDPYLLPETQHMIDAAQENLTAVMRGLVRPDGKNSLWMFQGCPLKIKRDYNLHQELSLIANNAFPHTPVVNNELVVRNHVSRQMVNARKKLILGILERSGKEDLGFVASATTPDVTMYRTTLLHSGLFGKQQDDWAWATPEQLHSSNEGLSKVWKEIEVFFTEPAMGKQFSDLIEKLVSPPYGTRRGLIPVLIAAGMKAFGKVFAVKRNGTYIPDILASQIEEICIAPPPSIFTLDVISYDNNLENYLISLSDVFSREGQTSDDLIRQFYDTINIWRAGLPASALTTRRVSTEAKVLQKAVRNEIDPVELSLHTLPRIVGSEKWDLSSIPTLRDKVAEIEGITNSYTRKAIGVIKEQLTISPDETGNTLQRAEKWASCLNGNKAFHENIGHTPKAILKCATEANGGKFNEAFFARAISTILLGKNFEEWDDAGAQQFENKLRDTVSMLEHTALMSTNLPFSMLPFVEGRIHYYEKARERLLRKTTSKDTRKNQQSARKRN